jgi:hypothetical protein
VVDRDEDSREDMIGHGAAPAAVHVRKPGV